MTAITSRTFTIKLSKCSEPRAARRVIFNSDILKAAKLSTGELVVLSSGVDSSNDAEAKFAVGIIWPSLDIPPDAVFISSSHLLTLGLEAGELVRIFPLSASASSSPRYGSPAIRSAEEAESICLRETLSSQEDFPSTVPSYSQKQQRDWLHLAAREVLVDLKYITSRQVIDLSYEGIIRQFTIHSIRRRDSEEHSQTRDLLQSINALSISSQPLQLWKVDWDCAVSILEDRIQVDERSSRAAIEITSNQPSRDAYASVGGLDKQIEVIRDLLEIPLTRPELFRTFGLKPPRGILLHGPPGTGKTHLARAIASSTKSSVLVINGPELSSAYHGETESKIRDVFRQAREKSPCIIVLDEVDALVPKREDGAGGEVEKRVVATLLTILDGMGEDNDDGNHRIVVIGTTNRPNAIDPALRRPGRFDREIEIGVPDADARFSILRVLLSNTPHSISQDELRSLAARMYGYVGADIGGVVREAGTLAIKRCLKRAYTKTESSSFPPNMKLELDDLVAAIPAVRPSAMRSLFFETPPVRYSDIGGQASVIQKLKEAVEWPLLHPNSFQRLGVRPPKGVLLYGPPGCSKTILARACACESGVNFVAVKGPELLSKFVGESERAVREIFGKARAASPSIVFFDEIDALATSRPTDAEHSSSHEGVLTTLLNEMDGVQELNGVTVIAATNRPEVLDPALMRPGRLDRILWVGPPDQRGREEILRIKIRKMSVGPDLNIESIAELTEGCSGAEISSLCQEAAILTMQTDMNAPHVPYDAFVAATRKMRKQITQSVLERFANWGDNLRI